MKQTQRHNIAVDPAQHRRLRQEATRTGETMGAIVAGAIERELRHRRLNRKLARELARAGRQPHVKEIK